MYFKLAIVLLSMVAVSQAGYFVINTWADENCNTTLVAKYIVSIIILLRLIQLKYYLTLHDPF